MKYTYLNTFKICVYSWHFWENTWLYVVGCSQALSFPSFCSWCLLICLIVNITLFLFFTKISSLRERGISFQILGCIFVTEFCVMLWKPLHWHLFLAYCHMPSDRHFKVPGKMWVQLASFFSSVVCFNIKDQFLGQIIVICQLNKAIKSVTNSKKC